MNTKYVLKKSLVDCDPTIVQPDSLRERPSLFLSNQHLFVATLDGKVSVVDPRSGRVVGECSGHREAVLDFAQTFDGQFVLTCSDDSECRVFDVNKITNGAAASDSA